MSNAIDTPRRRSKPRPGEPIKIIRDGTGRVRYQAVVTTTPPGVKRSQARRNFDTLPEARDFVAATKDAVRAGRYRQPDPVTLHQLVDRWAASRDDIRQITLDGYLQALKPILAAYGDRRVQDIDRALVGSWRASWPTSGGMRGRGLSRRSIELTIRVLVMVFGYAVAEKLITDNPAVGLRPPRETLADERKAQRRKTSAVVWSFAELRRFVAASDQTELAAGMRLSASGLRRSEVLGLDWASVDLDSGLVDVVQGRAKDVLEKVKSKASKRPVQVETMMPGTTKVLRELWIGQGRPDSGLVVLDADGMAYDRDLYSRAFRQVASSAGLPGVHLHSVRHAIATELHGRGVAPAVGARLLGHSLQTHLKHYVVATDDHVDQAAAAFGAAWTGEEVAA